MSSFNPGSTSSFGTGQAEAAQATPENQLAEHFSSAGLLSAEDPFGLANVSLTSGAIAGSTLSGALNNERYNKFLKKMQEIVEDPNNNPNVKISVLSLDKSVAPAVYFSTILVCTQSKLKPEAGVGVHALIIDGTNAPLPVMESTTNNISESIQRFPEQVWDGDLQSMIKTRVANMLPDAVPGNIFLTAPCVIGEEANPENDQQVFEILNNATLAANTSVAMFSSGGRYFQDLNLAAMVKAKKCPDLYISHTSAASVVAPNQVGNLSRISTVTKLTTGKPNKTSTYQPNSGKAAATVLEAGTYTDLMPVAPAAGTPGFNAAFNPWMQPPAPLMPLVVVSVVRTQFALTPGASLLALLAVADQVRNNHWASDFRHRGNNVNPGGIDFGDVGAIVVNQPDPNNPGNLMPQVSAAAPAFTDMHLWELLGRFVRNTAMIGIEVAEADAATWYLGLFTAAALQGSQKAIQRIHDTLDKLTDGAYNQLVKQERNGQYLPIFTGNVYHVERGFWRSGDKILPLELLDNYVAVCNYARAMNNPGLVNEYVDTIVGNRPQITRLLHKRKILDEMSGGTARFTRSSRRMLLNNDWATMAIKAVNSSGIVLHTDDSTSFSLTTNTGYATNLANVQAIGASMNVQGTGFNNQANTVGNNYGGW